MKSRHTANFRRTLLLSLLPVLFIISATVTAGNLAAQSVSATSPGVHFGTLPQSQDDPYMSRFFSIDDSVNLTVFTPNGSIEVAENASLSGVQVDLYVKREFSFWRGAQSLDNYRIIIQRNNNEVIATVENKDTGSRVRSDDSNQFSFHIQVPQNGKMNLRTMNGPIELEGVKGRFYLQNHIGDITVRETEGDIRVASTTGSLELNQLRGSIFAKSVSGDISATNSEGELRLRSEAGNLTALNTKGALIAATVTGDILSTFKEVSVGISLETINGNIDLTLPSTIGYSIEVTGMSYDFSSIRGSATQERTGIMSGFMKVRDGTLPVKLSSITGNIKVTESE